MSNADMNHRDNFHWPSELPVYPFVLLLIFIGSAVVIGFLGCRQGIEEKKVMALTRMGRKPLPEEDRRDKPLRIRMTDAEREQIDLAAELAGYGGSSGWAREVLLKAAKKQIAPSKRRKRG